MATQVDRKTTTPRVVEAGALNLEQAVHLYFHLQRQTQGLTAQVRYLRDHILEAMREQELERLSDDQLEVVRVRRHGRPRLDVEKAREVLKRHRRLTDAMVETLDEDRAMRVIAELEAAGPLEAGELPFEASPETEALVVREIGADLNTAPGSS